MISKGHLIFIFTLLLFKSTAYGTTTVSKEVLTASVVVLIVGALLCSSCIVAIIGLVVCLLRGKESPQQQPAAVYSPPQGTYPGRVPSQGALASQGPPPGANPGQGPPQGGFIVPAPKR